MLLSVPGLVFVALTMMLSPHLTVAVLLIGTCFLLERLRRSEQAIRKQLDFLQLIIDAIPIPVFYKDAQGRFLGCNKEYESFVGHTRQQVVGRTVHDLWHKEAADLFLNMDRQLLEREGVQVYENSSRHADGSERIVMVHKALFKNQEGDTGGTVGVLLDITERQRAEAEVIDAYRKISDILEFLPDPTFVVDREHRVIAWNLAMERLSGVPKGEILGEREYAHALPFYGERRRTLIDMLDEGQEAQNTLYRNIKRNGNTLSAEGTLTLHGSERYLWSAASPIFDRQGNKAGGIQTLRDLTELKQAERERSRLELQLQHAGLVKSLLSRLSHDLTTPLTPLFALLPLLQQKVEDPKLRRMLEICQESVGQIQGLTDKALNLVRFSVKNVPLDFAELRLADTAQSAVRGCAAQLEKRGIRCLNTIDPALGVTGIQEQLALLFDNILANAARFAAENGEIRIDARREGETVVVSVGDDGTGLEPEHCKLIFDEFFKVDRARHDTGNQGLGLSICKSIVLNHHGRIWAESPGLNRGSTIYFTLQAGARS